MVASGNSEDVFVAVEWQTCQETAMMGVPPVKSSRPVMEMQYTLSYRNETAGPNPIRKNRNCKGTPHPRPCR